MKKENGHVFDLDDVLLKQDLANVLWQDKWTVATEALYHPLLVAQAAYEACFVERGALEKWIRYFERGGSDGLASVARHLVGTKTMDPDMIVLLETLLEKGYSLWWATNESEEECQAHRIRFPLLQQFQGGLAVNYNVPSKVEKPSLVYFQTLAAKIPAVQREHIFFVDDQPGHVRGAIEAGWHAVVFESAQQLVDEWSLVLIL